MVVSNWHTIQFSILGRSILPHIITSLREVVESREIQVQPSATIEQTADLLTKPFGKQLFEKFRDALQITSAKDQMR